MSSINGPSEDSGAAIRCLIPDDQTMVRPRQPRRLAQARCRRRLAYSIQPALPDDKR
jgi:hypothetical protein